jgi:microcystin-dependent protein
MVEESGYLVPSGIIVMWKGSVASIPDGWALCNGSNGTPDLRDRFIVGARQDDGGVAKTNVTGSLTQTGGEVTHTLTEAELPSHRHQIKRERSVTTGSDTTKIARTADTSSTIDADVFSEYTGGDLAHNTLPVYYALAFIMKL